MKLLQPLIMGHSERPILPLSVCQPIITMRFRLSRDHPMTAVCNHTETEIVNLKKGIRKAPFTEANQTVPASGCKR